ncbi:hypothetical protein CB1_000875058 [Camelus ferus]|nr:hypothetical protein CB1_000875058 [Camelus ferus]
MMVCPGCQAIVAETEHPTGLCMVSCGPQDRGDQRQSRDAYVTREGLLPATEMSSSLVLEPLWDALLVVSESLRRAPGLWETWETLLCAAMVDFIVESWRSLRRGAELAKKCSARAEVYRKVREKPGPMAQAHEGLKMPAVAASAPLLQTLCVVALHKNLSRSSLEDVKDVFEKGPSFHRLMMAHLQGQIWSLGDTSESHQSQVTEAKNLLKTSQGKVQHLQKKPMDGLHENIFGKV